MKYILKQLKGLLIGSALIVLALCCLQRTDESGNISALDRLPDHDYITEISELMNQKRFGEAQTLCEDVIALNLPCAGKAEELKEQSKKESEKIFNRFFKAGKGFITGAPDSSPEELAGCIVSDMFMYGDIRDLTMQGYYKFTKKETDPVIAGLAAAGLLTEFVDVADWAPAVLKAFRKIGAITDEMGKYILKITDDILKKQKISSDGKIFFGNLKTLLDKAGFIRSGNIVKHAKNADEIAILAKSAEKSPHATHLVARAADRRACEVIDVVNKHKNSPTLMRKIAQKGAKSVKLITRTGKILHKGHPVQMLRQLLGKYFYLLCLILFSSGAVFICLSLKNMGTSVKKRIDFLRMGKQDDHHLAD